MDATSGSAVGRPNGKSSRGFWPGNLDCHVSELDVVIGPDEPRYWVALGACVVGAAAFLWWTGRMKGDDRCVRHAIGFTMLGMQVFEIVHTLTNPAMDFSIHRSLPLHFCGLNAILLGILCFRFNPHVFTFAGFLGMIGGFHSVLTPQLPSGDALPLFILFYLKHAALVVVPIAMARSLGAWFPKWAWIRAYGIAVALSTLVMGINALLNGPFAHPDGLVANYMYVWEIPQANNPLLIDWPWPWYLAPLHVALLVHLLVVNAMFRRFLPVSSRDRTLRWYE